MAKNINSMEFFCLSHAYLNVIKEKNEYVREFDMVFSNLMLNIFFNEKEAMVKTYLQKSCMKWLKNNGYIERLKLNSNYRLNNGMLVLTSNIENFYKSSHVWKLMSNINIEHTVNVLEINDNKLLILDQSMPIKPNSTNNENAYWVSTNSSVMENYEFTHYQLTSTWNKSTIYSMNDISKIVINSKKSIIKFWTDIIQFAPKLSQKSAQRISLSMIDSGYIAGKFLLLNELKNINLNKAIQYESNLKEFQKYFFQFRMILFTYGLGKVDPSMETKTKNKLILVCKSILSCESKLIKSIS